MLIQSIRHQLLLVRSYVQPVLEVAALDGERDRIDVARRLDHRLNLADARPFGSIVILLGVGAVLDDRGQEILPGTDQLVPSQFKYPGQIGRRCDETIAARTPRRYLTPASNHTQYDRVRPLDAASSCSLSGSTCRRTRSRSGSGPRGS